MKNMVLCLNMNGAHCVFVTISTVSHENFKSCTPFNTFFTLITPTITENKKTYDSLKKCQHLP